MAHHRHARRWAVGCACLAAALALAGCGPTTDSADTLPAPLQSSYVNPKTGSDDNDGSRDHPFKTIQSALDDAKPGTQINLAPGTYRERLTTRADGTSDHPIVIKGPESGRDPADRRLATVVDASRVVNIDHSHYVLEGFTVDGQPDLSGTDIPTSLDDIAAFKRRVEDRVADSKLIYLGSADTSRDVTGVTIRDMFLTGAGGECVRLRNNAHDNTIVDSVIEYCGMYGKSVGDSDSEFHNGEGIYIGTSPGSSDQPMADDDTGSGNVITGNLIRTFGTECLDVKENAHDNMFEDNTCSDNAESTKDGGSLVELRGHDNVVRGNRLSHSLGYGVKIRSDGPDYDKGGNVVEDNRISDTAGTPIFIKSDAEQGHICGNRGQDLGASC
jgi:hypothetical protein